MIGMMNALHLMTLSYWKDLVSRLGIEPRTSDLGSAASTFREAPPSLIVL